MDDEEQKEKITILKDGYLLYIFWGGFLSYFFFFLVFDCSENKTSIVIIICICTTVDYRSFMRRHKQASVD